MNWGLLADRSVWLGIGVVIGFVLGYANRARQEAHEANQRVEQFMTEHADCPLIKEKQQKEQQQRDAARRWGERGAANFNSVAMAVVVIVVVVAAFVSGNSATKANRSLAKANQALARVQAVSDCNQHFLFQTIAAANGRTQFSTAAADANVDLQRSQAKFLAVVLQAPPAEHAARQQALQNYFDDLTHFTKLSVKSTVAQQQNPYPTERQYSSCLTSAKEVS